MTILGIELKGASWTSRSRDWVAQTPNIWGFWQPHLLASVSVKSTFANTRAFIGFTIISPLFCIWLPLGPYLLYNYVQASFHPILTINHSGAEILECQCVVGGQSWWCNMWQWPPMYIWCHFYILPQGIVRRWVHWTYSLYRLQTFITQS